MLLQHGASDRPARDAGSKTQEKIPLVLRGQKKWIVRLFNCGCSNVAMRRAGIKAISGYRGVVWQSEAICRYSV
ncbi:MULTISPECIES: hypothetical protein [Paraburkholderia]|jgi:hypothetical protein|uniref:hypothetical protein n=1 Tax=Paraburkholderia TaxID=1822464 RepID=UPI0015DB85BB|nr:MULTISPECIES: hypothetical protein [Paraburkholderia]GJH01773.1 hypothetical protein CBA19C8_14470 [Paraburkholderia terrae]GJH37003.1 hypothetical protein CBA19CS91_29620 [Paraburkholderia hospita]